MDIETKVTVSCADLIAIVQTRKGFLSVDPAILKVAIQAVRKDINDLDQYIDRALELANSQGTPDDYRE